MPVELLKIAATDRPTVEHLFQCYLHDMSEFTGWSISDDGWFTYPPDLLFPHWEDVDHHPYFIVKEGEIAGFSLVRRSPESDHIWDMGQFFVLRKFRGSGLGRLAFFESLNQHKGKWQVRILPENKPAYQFWKTCIKDGSDGVFDETTKDYKNLKMTFFSFLSDTQVISGSVI
jgi:predicted acetyltransferase